MVTFYNIKRKMGDSYGSLTPEDSPPALAKASELLLPSLYHQWQQKTERYWHVLLRACVKSAQKQKQKETKKTLMIL